uniref:Uncharacterized protein n=1 Tax=Glossina austeni TaxID=7395 RepID=A0A1A9UWA0_GLOAU
MLANSIPPIAVLACCTSDTSSEATLRCLSKGWAKGDSKTGSIGSKGLIKCTKMHIFGSDTSKTLKGLDALAPVLPSTGVGGSLDDKNNDLRIYQSFAICNLTGMPAGRKRSTLCTGIMKQSRSNAASDIGSVLAALEPGTTAPPKTTTTTRRKQQQNSGSPLLCGKARKWIAALWLLYNDLMIMLFHLKSDTDGLRSTRGCGASSSCDMGSVVKPLHLSAMDSPWAVRNIAKAKPRELFGRSQ